MLSAERRLIPLRNEIRPYAWGSPTDIPAMLGMEPTGEPAAEMWIGAHPGAPSRAADRDAHEDAAAEAPTLREIIAADPLGTLGADVVRRFGPELPYLLKLLAAHKPVSLQTHPTIAQARAGYAAEDADGVPLDAAHRSYLDENHKPELLCALTPVEALCGFRPVQDSALFLRAAARAGAPALASMAERLIADGGLRDVVTWLLTLPPPEQAELAAAAGAACAQLCQQPGRWLDDADLIARIAALHPRDGGVVLAMLLNHVRLGPGEAIYLAAGQIHSYIEGFGVELMASSDNVLRAGLTGKHINIPELLRTVAFDAGPAQVLAPAEAPDGELRYITAAPDFALHRLEVQPSRPIRLERIQPSLLLCVAGEAQLSAGDQRIALRPGAAAFAAAGSDLLVDGAGTLFRATIGPLHDHPRPAADAPESRPGGIA